MTSPPQRSMLWLMRYILPVKWRMAGLLALLLLTTAMQLANPQMVQHFIDTAAGGGPVSRLLGLASAYLAIAVCTQLTSVAVSYLGNDVAWRATNQLRADLLRHCLGLDMRFHNLRTPGEMMERIDGDVTHMSNFFAMFIVQMFGSAVLLAGILGLMFAQNVPIAAIMTAFTLLSLAAMVRIRDVGVAASQAERQANAALFGLIEERIAGIEDVQTSGAVPHVMNRFHRAMRHVFQTGRRAWMMRVIPWNVTVVLYAMAVTGVLMMGIHLYLTRGATLGTLYLFYQYTQMLNDPIEQLGNQLQDYQRAKSGMRRSLELLSMRSEIEEGQRTDLPEGPLGVAFEHVHFSYQPGEPVLHDIHFELRPGERLGIVGRTGSGKSSISRLLLRLYNLDSGVIRLGGVDIRELRLDTLYERVGMVTQDVQLFDGTLRDNLTLFNPGVPEAEILAVVDRLGLRPLLDRLPEGLDTRLAAGGSSLSAGEAQLVALTRVFLTKPSLVILDEPSSRLDPATEATLQTAIDHLLEHCTGIVIAHRLSTLAKVDKILVLGQGRMLEFGDRAALADDPASHFAALLRKDRLEVWA
ncbi:ABC transporter ATP-binding protein [Alicyclobacillus macrosporangiidus]|uniref:ATP-binding cassette, subfamily B n=1 Tax=Alicyclobacillus macrosporangiidus TaxID=392015 RepID=A0A1I7JR57_9BACL|nr:ABC transporter ATP-binding protein [Alicyclobacillus macrosporangiidus]SFU87630.1 ATP-binding cassette, subfamily B [Alicyclobacillus macrosporangiidus]